MKKMLNNYLSVLYKHIIQVENENVGLKVCVCVWGGGGGTNIPLPPPNKKNQSQDATFSRLHTTEQDPINNRGSIWGL